MFFALLSPKVMGKSTEKENVDYLLRLRSIRYLQTPCVLIRVKAHALRRVHPELLLLYAS